MANMANGTLGILLDSLLIVLILVFVYLAFKRLILGESPKPSRRRKKEGISEADVDEVSTLISERGRLRDYEQYLKRRYLDGEITIEQFRELSKEAALQVKAIERRLKMAGLM